MKDPYKEFAFDYDEFGPLDEFYGGEYDVVYRILLDDDYRRLLSEAGFRSVSIYGDYDMSPYDEKSGRLIVVAEV